MKVTTGVTKCDELTPDKPAGLINKGDQWQHSGPCSHHVVVIVNIVTNLPHSLPMTLLASPLILFLHTHLVIASTLSTMAA